MTSDSGTATLSNRRRLDVGRFRKVLSTSRGAAGPIPGERIPATMRRD